ncbi:MAG TPA: PASTA domain-containing protein [Bacteroidia bacterium]|nr:PASTA domain-containing protein [Bacteroidia bacterium]
MKPFFNFIKSKIFIINAIAAVALMLLFFGFTYKWLNTYTRHGSSVSVPDLKGMQKDKLDEFLQFKNLKYKISDSTIFDLSQPPGTVIEQDPQPNEKVKEDRTIYLSITRSTPPGVKIPELLDNSLRQAEAILRSYGLIRGQLIYKPDLAKNAVLEMQIDGRSVKPGEEVTKGTVIDLVLGDGFGNTKVPVPQLFNLTLDEAMFVINASSLNIGAIVFDSSVRDSTKAKVYKQFPLHDAEAAISQGESIDLFLTQSESVIKLHDPELIQETNEETNEK